MGTYKVRKGHRPAGAMRLILEIPEETGGWNQLWKWFCWSRKPQKEARLLPRFCLTLVPVTSKTE